MSLGQHIRVFLCVSFMGLLVGYVLNSTETERESHYIDYVQMQPWPYNTDLTIAELVEQHFDQLTAHTKDIPTIVQFIVQEDLTSYQIGAIKLNEITLPKDKKWSYVQNLAS